MGIAKGTGAAKELLRTGATLRAPVEEKKKTKIPAHGHC